MAAQLGPPEEVFGPNRRFRAASTFWGAVLILLGVGFWVLCALGIPWRGKAYFILGAGLVFLGGVAIVVPMQMPAVWLFVCPRGMARRRGEVWESIEWANVLRFEDVTPPNTLVRIKQCRLALADGGEWGFLAEYVSDFDRLTEILRRKVASDRAPPAFTA